MVTKYTRALALYNVTLLNKPRREYYVYRYSVDSVPFYIGVGQGYRYLAHLVNASQFMRRKLEKLRRNKIAFEIKIVFHTNDRQRALDKEIELIARYGRYGEGGILVNCTIGGDGGDTYQGRKIYHNPKTGEARVFAVGGQPKGWQRGWGETAKTRVRNMRTCYNPKTEEVRRVQSGENLPKGFVLGVPDTLCARYGPRGKVVICNAALGQNKWIDPNEEIPAGWRKGRLPDTTTRGRTAYHDPRTGEKRYIQPGEKPPKGWVRGLKPTTGKPVMVGKKRFPSVQAAMDFYKTTRYLLCKRPDFKQLEK